MTDNRKKLYTLLDACSQDFPARADWLVLADALEDASSPRQAALIRQGNHESLWVVNRRVVDRIVLKEGVSRINGMDAIVGEDAYAYPECCDSDAESVGVIVLAVKQGEEFPETARRLATQPIYVGERAYRLSDWNEQSPDPLADQDSAVYVAAIVEVEEDSEE